MSLGSAPRGSYLCELMSQPFAELTIFSIPANIHLKTKRMLGVG